MRTEQEIRDRIRELIVIFQQRRDDAVRKIEFGGGYNIDYLRGVRDAYIEAINDLEREMERDQL